VSRDGTHAGSRRRPAAESARGPHCSG
jgi:hypothetical protein